MEFFAIITLVVPLDGGGIAQATTSEVVTAESTAKRSDIYQYMRRKAVQNSGAHFADATVVFFSAEPNGLSLEDMFTSGSGTAGS